MCSRPAARRHVPFTCRIRRPGPLPVIIPVAGPSIGRRAPAATPRIGSRSFHTSSFVGAMPMMTVSIVLVLGRKVARVVLRSASGSTMISRTLLALRSAIRRPGTWSMQSRGRAMRGRVGSGMTVNIAAIAERRYILCLRFGIWAGHLAVGLARRPGSHSAATRYCNGRPGLPPSLQLE
jgi:hypothetical protein